MKDIVSMRGDAEIARLRLQAAHAEVERLRLTDEEREAPMADAADWLRHAVASGAIQVARLESEIERLRLTDAERDVLATVRDIYASHDDDDSCSRIAAVIDGLLERTK
jgi:hypothetical protein